MHRTPTELPHTRTARRLWLGPRSPHLARVEKAEPWVARWQDLPREAPVAIEWDGSHEAVTALWVATRLGLAVTAVSRDALPAPLWQDLDDQCVTFGGSIQWAQELPAGRPVVRPAA